MQKDLNAKDQEFIEQITQKGYNEQFEYLYSLGHHKVKRIYKLLLKYNGDPQQVIDHLSKKQEIRALKEKNKIKYEELNAQLVHLGYFKKGQNFKALAKADGNIDMAIGILKEKQDKKYLKKQNKIQRGIDKQVKMQAKAGLKQNVLALKEQGFPDEKRNMKVLKQFNGDLEKSKDFLIDQQNNFQNLLTGVTHYYLDGNNMLFCDDNIRKLVLNRQSQQAQQELFEIVKRTKGAQLVYLLFDQMKYPFQTEIAGTKYIVESAKKLGFNTSDDCLVHMSAQIPKDQHSLFVTSDKGLRERLQGYKMLKSGQYLNTLK